MNAHKNKTTESEKDGFLYDPDEAVRYLSSVDMTLGKLIKRAVPGVGQFRRVCRTN
jgi:hypothetical protein